MNLPIEFRRVGSDLWFSGYTEKMGTHGVLFRAGGLIEPQSRIEMIFRTPTADPCNLVCTGTVLRIELPTAGAFLPAIAATIDHFSFVKI